jgi:hypothetical protein
MKTSLFFLVLSIALIRLQAASVKLDFSRSHTIEDVKKSGLLLNQIKGGTDELDFSFQNQEIEVLLPGGRTFRQFVELGIIDSKNGLLSRFSTSGGVMPQEQAYLVARIFHQSFGLPLNNLEEWNRRNQGNGLSGEAFGVSPTFKYYPIVGIAIVPGTNKLYPWDINFKIEWGWREQRDWNEERVWRELPPPAITAVSLEPPSGLKYDRRDAFKDALEAQKKFEQEQAAKRQASTPAPPDSISRIATPSPSPASQTELPESSSWAWAVVGIVVLLIVALALKRRS